MYAYYIYKNKKTYALRLKNHLMLSVWNLWKRNDLRRNWLHLYPICYNSPRRLCYNHCVLRWRDLLRHWRRNIWCFWQLKSQVLWERVNVIHKAIDRRYFPIIVRQLKKTLRRQQRLRLWLELRRGIKDWRKL